MTELDERMELAVSIALEAAAIPRRYFLNDALVVDRKADNSPVTRADKEAEELLRSRIEATCPSDAIVGEEYDDKLGSSGYKWYLDPIDGTESFVRGVPLFGTMVALNHGGDAIGGVIVFPALGEIIYGSIGSGAWWATNVNDAVGIFELDRREAKVSSVSQLQDAGLSTTNLSHYFEKLGVEDQWQSLLRKVKVGRGFSDCYGHYLVATGRMDIMIDPEMNVWDNAPLLPIVVEAGGRFTNMAGVATIDGGSGVSTNGLLHDAVIAELRN